MAYLVVGPTNVVNIDDMRMLDGHQCLQFAWPVILAVILAELVVEHHLDGHRLIRLGVLALEHPTEGARVEFLFDGVAMLFEDGLRLGVQLERFFLLVLVLVLGHDSE